MHIKIASSASNRLDIDREERERLFSFFYVDDRKMKTKEKYKKYRIINRRRNVMRQMKKKEKSGHTKLQQLEKKCILDNRKK